MKNEQRSREYRSRNQRQQRPQWSPKIRTHKTHKKNGNCGGWGLGCCMHNVKCRVAFGAFWAVLLCISLYSSASMSQALTGDDANQQAIRFQNKSIDKPQKTTIASSSLLNDCENKTASKRKPQLFRLVLEPEIRRMPDWMIHSVRHQQHLLHLRLEEEDPCRQGSSTKRTPQLEWICPSTHTVACGGVGDRLYGLVMTFYMALLTNRSFGISSTSWAKWASPYLESSWEESSQQGQSVVQSNNNLNTKGVLLKVGDNRRHPALLEPCQTPPLNDIVAAPKVLVQNNIFTRDHLWRSMACFQQFCESLNSNSTETCHTIQDDPRSLFHLGFWALFRLTQRVHNMAHGLKRKAFGRPYPSSLDSQDSQAHNQKEQHPHDAMTKMTIIPSHYIAVHIRTGQGETWEDPLRHTGEAALNQFYQCSMRVRNALQQHCPNPASNKTGFSVQWPVYVAADNNYAKQRILSLDAREQNGEKIFYADQDLEILHLAKSRREEFDDASLAQDQVWGELKVLMDSTCLIMSHSKFSYLAADLSPLQPRCALLFDQCEDTGELQRVVSHVVCP